MRLQPILDRVAEAATSLCRSEYSLIHLVEGEMLYAQANVGVPPEVMEYERLHPLELGVQTLAGRVASTKRPVHIPDVAADPDYDFPAIMPPLASSRSAESVGSSSRLRRTIRGPTRSSSPASGRPRD